MRRRNRYVSPFGGPAFHASLAGRVSPGVRFPANPSVLHGCHVRPLSPLNSQYALIGPLSPNWTVVTPSRNRDVFSATPPELEMLKLEAILKGFDATGPGVGMTVIVPVSFES